MNRAAICTITRGEILFGLEHLDLDATRPEQVEAIENYADLWLNDEARNHAIRINRQTSSRRWSNNGSPVPETRGIRSSFRAEDRRWGDADRFTLIRMEMPDENNSPSHQKTSVARSKRRSKTKSSRVT